MEEDRTKKKKTPGDFWKSKTPIQNKVVSTIKALEARFYR